MRKSSNELMIYKDNYLVEASYKLSLMEQRIILFAISRLDPRNPQDKHSFYVSELLKFYPDIEPSSAYRVLREAVKKLYDRSVRTEDPEKVREFRWIESGIYFKDEGRIDVIFTKSIMPYLSQLESQFTRYQLENVASFRGTYSIRLYELLTQYKTLGEREISVDELNALLQIGNKYGSFKELNRSVIKPAIEEINVKSDLFITIEPKKCGRKITALRFRIKHKHKETAETKPKHPKSAETQLDLVEELDKKTKTRKIHGVFVEIARPQVTAGSHAEGEWANNNYNNALKQMRQGGIFTRRFVDEQLSDIPDSWLKVLLKFAKVINRTQAREISGELARRKAKLEN